LLDLSVEFDTVDRDILLACLKVSFAICGAALDWFQLYLTSRVECVRFGPVDTKDRSVWQTGSVLSSLLFILDTAGLIDLNQSINQFISRHSTEARATVHAVMPNQGEMSSDES